MSNFIDKIKALLSRPLARQFFSVIVGNKKIKTFISKFEQLAPLYFSISNISCQNVYKERQGSF